MNTRDMVVELAEALQEMDALVEGLWESVDWGKTRNLDVQALNETPLKAKIALKHYDDARSRPMQYDRYHGAHIERQEPMTNPTPEQNAIEALRAAYRDGCHAVLTPAQVTAIRARLDAPVESREPERQRVLVQGVWEPLCNCVEPSIGTNRGYRACQRCGGLLRWSKQQAAPSGRSEAREGEVEVPTDAIEWVSEEARQEFERYLEEDGDPEPVEEETERLYPRELWIDAEDDGDGDEAGPFDPAWTVVSRYPEDGGRRYVRADVASPTHQETEALREALKEALADYIASEGCRCCRDVAAHAIAEARLAELLGVPMYEDGSGYDWSLCLTRTTPDHVGRSGDKGDDEARPDPIDPREWPDA